MSKVGCIMRIRRTLRASLFLAWVSPRAVIGTGAVQRDSADNQSSNDFCSRRDAFIKKFGSRELMRPKLLSRYIIIIIRRRRAHNGKYEIGFCITKSLNAPVFASIIRYQVVWICTRKNAADAFYVGGKLCESLPFVSVCAFLLRFFMNLTFFF